MFEQLYKPSIKKIQLGEVFVENFKSALHKEIDKKTDYFHGWITIAACFIITFSLFKFAWDM